MEKLSTIKILTIFPRKTLKRFNKNYIVQRRQDFWKEIYINLEYLNCKDNSGNKFLYNRETNKEFISVLYLL